MSYEQTKQLLTRIPDAHTRWPEWFWPYCAVCGEGCEKSRKPEDNNTPVLICLNCGSDVDAPEWRFDPLTEGDSPMTMWGGDLLDERNLHHLFRIADALTEGEEVDSSKGFGCVDFWARVGDRMRSGPTRSASLFAAIAARVGVV